MASNIYSKKSIWKILLLFSAIIIALASLLYTNNLVNKLSYEEEKKAELIAEAWRHLLDDSKEMDVSFLLQIIKNNETLPVILADKDDHIISWRNLDSAKVSKQSNYLSEMLLKMKEQNPPIEVPVGENSVQYIYYKNSILIDALQYYPWVQLTIISLFIIIAYYAFSSSRNAEQNQVWVGMSKETAHQLGTPLSSLYGWTEYLKSTGIDEKILLEIEKDLKRLNTITDRFSKIGSVPVLKPEKINPLLSEIISYMEKRFSKNIEVEFKSHLSKDIQVPISKSLFEWVIENICKNAVDAMSGNGKLFIECSYSIKNEIIIDVSDTGKGLTKSQFKQVFKPGFTTKKRGWGLGLSLAKRIIEQYHHGKIFVTQSEINKGTTFRIVLKGV